MKRHILLPLLLIALALPACKEEQANNAGGAPEIEVGVMKVDKRRLEVTAELPGRTSAFRIAEIRPQVTGIITERLFDEGALVEAGQQLYQIDPAPYEATLASTKADLQKAQAAVAAADARVARYNTLVKNDVVSRQNYDDAIAAQLQGKADVAAAHAAIDAAEINLRRTKVEAPISGRISKSAVTEGALVTANQDIALTTIQQLDPIYVDMTQSASQLLELRRQIAAGRLEQSVDSTPVSLKLTRTEMYDQEGKLSFADVTVDEGTATVQLRAIFPNPANELLPGLFVKAVINQAVRENAVLIPQRALTRGADGRSTVWVVDDQNLVHPRSVTTERALGNAWLISDGLKGGEVIIVAGVQKVKPDQKVKPVEQPIDLKLDFSDAESSSNSF